MADALELSAFKHVVVPIGVVIALGVARIMSGLSDYAQNAARVRFAPGHGIWTGILFLIFVALWWIVWGLRQIPAESWSFFTLVYLLVGPSLLLLVATLMLPSVPDEGTLDLGGQLEHVGRICFLCLLGFILWLVGVESGLLGEPLWQLPKRAMQLTACGIFGWAALRPDRRTHAWTGGLLLTVLLVVLGTLRSRLV